jgi:hypothetical protein
MAGEQQDLSTDIYSKGRWTKGMQNQLLTPMGKNWMQGEAKYTDNQLVDFLRYFNSNESTATFDSPIDINNGGALYEDHMKQMKRVLSVLNVEDRIDGLNESSTREEILNIKAIVSNMDSEMKKLIVSEKYDKLAQLFLPNNATEVKVEPAQ